MKTAICKPQPESRTIDPGARAGQQAPAEIILQRYTQTVAQRAGPDEDELLQGKFKTAQREGIGEDELLQGKFDTVQREDIEEDELLQARFETIQRLSPEEEEPLQEKTIVERRSENRTGMPDNLKTGVENLSGYSMDDVRVHYNSPKPAQLQALAYTQGTDIHVGPGQEKHLPHEAWHVVQQKQGRVQPTMQLRGVNINDNTRLEKEADVYASKFYNNPAEAIPKFGNVSSSGVIQRYMRIQAAGGDYIQAPPVAGPGNPIPQIMVKENEAATVYLRQGVAIPNELNRLGVNVLSNNNIPDPMVPPVMPNFSQYTQGRIHIGGLQQPMRSPNARGRALGHLQRQLRFLNRLNGFIQPIRNELGPGGGVQANLTAIAGNIRTLLDQKTGNLDNGLHRTRRRTIGALGMDIINAAFALYEIASEQINQPAAPVPLPVNPLPAAHYTSAAEKLQIIEVIESDILLRISQVDREIASVDNEPIIRTGCDSSAFDRSDYIQLNKEWKQAMFHKGPLFNEEIGWAFHKSTQINVGNLTPDTLFIEDAVGKSSSAHEKANSHWFAKIYGSQQPLLGGLQIAPLAPINGGLIPVAQPHFFPENKYNALAQGVKQAFCAKRGLAPGNSWSITYEDEHLVQPNLSVNYGRMTIEIAPDFRFRYQFIAGTNQTLTEGMQDFMIQTANNVVEGMMIEEFAHRGYSRRMGLAQALTTQNISQQMKNRFVRALNGRYKLEDFR